MNRSMKDKLQLNNVFLMYRVGYVPFAVDKQFTHIPVFMISRPLMVIWANIRDRLGSQINKEIRGHD